MQKIKLVCLLFICFTLILNPTKVSAITNKEKIDGASNINSQINDNIVYQISGCVEYVKDSLIDFINYMLKIRNSIVEAQSPNNKDLNQVITASNAPYGLEIGNRVHNFEFVLLNGQKSKISDYSGKVILLNFWATWSEACVSEMAVMQKVREKFDVNQVSILCINVWDTEKLAKEFQNNNKFTFDIGIDNDELISNTFKLDMIPKTFVINKKGEILSFFNGASNEQAYQQAINNALME